MCELPKAQGQYKRFLKWNFKGNNYLTLLHELDNYEEEFRHEERVESGKDLFVKKSMSKNQIEKLSNSTKKDVSEVTCYNGQKKSQYVKDCKDPKLPNLGKKDKKTPSKKT